MPITRKCYLFLNEKLETVLWEGENLIRKQNSFPTVFIKTNSCYCVMALRTENDVISKEAMIL